MKKELIRKYNHLRLKENKIEVCMFNRHGDENSFAKAVFVNISENYKF